MAETKHPDRIWKPGLLACLWLGGLGITVYIFTTYGWSGRHLRFRRYLQKEPVKPRYFSLGI